MRLAGLVIGDTGKRNSFMFAGWVIRGTDENNYTLHKIWDNPNLDYFRLYQNIWDSLNISYIIILQIMSNYLEWS